MKQNYFLILIVNVERLFDNIIQPSTKIDEE